MQSVCLMVLTRIFLSVSFDRNLERPQRFLDQACGGSAVHRHPQVHFHLRRRRRGDGVDRMDLAARRKGAALSTPGRLTTVLRGWYNDGFAASGTIDLRAGACAIHGQLLFALRTIKYHIHNARLSSADFSGQSRSRAAISQPKSCMIHAAMAPAAGSSSIQTNIGSPRASLTILSGRMWIVRLALRRPYTFVVAALVLLLLTPFVLLRTPTDIFPSINIPVVSIVWQYAGLNAQEIEQRIIYNHERVAHHHGQRHRAHRVQRLQRHRRHQGLLPRGHLGGCRRGAGHRHRADRSPLRCRPGTTPPLIIRYNASTVPILQYSLSSPKLSEQEIFDLAPNQIRVGLATVQRRGHALALRRQDAHRVGGPRPGRAEGEEPGARWTWSMPSTPRT